MAQVHVKDAIPSAHDPPFAHGFGAQSSMLEHVLPSPLYPLVHVHEAIPPATAHVAFGLHAASVQRSPVSANPESAIPESGNPESSDAPESFTDESAGVDESSTLVEESDDVELFASADELDEASLFAGPASLVVLLDVSSPSPSDPPHAATNAKAQRGRRTTRRFNIVISKNGR